MAEVAAKQRKHKMSRLEKKNTLIAYSFLAPNFLGFAIFTLVPVVCAILLAFVEWNGGDISNAHFVGLQNFAEIFKADKVASKWANGDYLYFFNRVDLGIALKNTVFYALINVPLTLVCAIALALALNKAKGAVAFRTIFFFPYVASMVAICVCWNFMLMKDGPVNQMIMALGINFNKSWTADSTMAMWAIILVSVWRSMGYYMVIYLAALQGVPRELYEAATVDGANKWQETWHVVIPHLIPVMVISTILGLGSLFQGDFGLFYQVPKDVGLLYPTTDVINTYTYRALQSGSFGKSTAVSLFQSTMGCLMVLITNGIVRKVSPENSLF